MLSKVEREAGDVASGCANHLHSESQNTTLTIGISDEPPQKRNPGEKHLMELTSDVIHPPSQSQSLTEKALAEAR